MALETPFRVEQMALLREALQGETALAQRLYETLAQEQLALGQMDAEKIQTLAKAKSDLLLQMDYALAERQKLIPAEFAESSLEEMLKQAPELVARSLRPSVETFRDWIYRCHRQNEVNGRIINGSRRSILRSLNLLRGQNPDMVVYTAKGAARLIGPCRQHATV